MGSDAISRECQNGIKLTDTLLASAATGLIAFSWQEIPTPLKVTKFSVLFDVRAEEK